MIAVPLNFFVLPLMIVVWALDSMLFVIILRIAIVDRFGKRQLKEAFQAFTDPVFHLVGDCIAIGLDRRLPDWQVRAITTAGLVLIRMVVVIVILTFA